MAEEVKRGAKVISWDGNTHCNLLRDSLLSAFYQIRDHGGNPALRHGVSANKQQR